MSDSNGSDATKVSYYRYFDPSKPAAIVTFCLFTLGLVVSLVQTIRLKAWVWMFMVLAIAMEAVGFGSRMASANDPTNRSLYIVQFLMVFIAPVWMAGIIYVVFGRIVFHVVPPHARTFGLLWVPARWVTPIFVAFDVISLLLQMIGGIIVSSTKLTDPDAAKKIDSGKKFALGGVSFQIGAFGLFIIIALRFHFTSRRFKNLLQQDHLSASDIKKGAGMSDGKRTFDPSWGALLNAVSASCILIMIRSIFREVQFAMGQGTYLNSVEWPYYVLDALPIFFCVLVYIIYPPGKYVSMGLRQPKDFRGQLQPGSGSDAEAHPTQIFQ